MNKTIVFCAGVTTGVVATKIIPKSKLIQHTKFVAEAFRSRNRLQKICIEEYERLDDAMDIEQKLFDMMSANLGLEVKFRMKDEDGQRSVSVSIMKKELHDD